MKLNDFHVLTFDCYGTLIDWESGLFASLQPLLARLGTGLSRDEALTAFGKHEHEQQVQTPGMLYSELLAQVYRRLAREWGLDVGEAEAIAFGKSIPDWPAFPDTVEALKYLKRHYKLVILSNVDRQSFAGTNKRLGVGFDAIYTAQDIGSYKPDPRNFEYMLRALEQLGVSRQAVLHTAQSLYHDHVPANAAKLASAWIDRRHQQGGGGASLLPKDLPHFDFRFTSLGEMAQAHEAETQHSPKKDGGRRTT